MLNPRFSLLLLFLLLVLEVDAYAHQSGDRSRSDERPLYFMGQSAGQPRLRGLSIAMLTHHPGREREDLTFIKRSKQLSDSLSIAHSEVSTGLALLDTLKAHAPLDFVVIFSHADSMGLLGQHRCGLYVNRVKRLLFHNRHGYGGGQQQAYSKDWVSLADSIFRPGAVVVLPSCYTLDLAEELSLHSGYTVYAGAGPTGPELIRRKPYPPIETGRYTCPAGGFYRAKGGELFRLSESTLDPYALWWEQNQQMP